MNKFITTLLSIFLILFSIYILPIKEIQTAFSSGDAEKIMAMAAPKILISINGKKGVYSPSQGTQVLEVFFKKQPPKSFNIQYKGEHSGVNSFALGTYISTHKQSFQVSIKFKKTSNKNQITTLTIDK